MNIEQLEYLIEVARTGAVSAAANNLHVSQSAVSKSISRLEQDLGLSLFTRSRTGLTPTPAGLPFIDKAAEIVAKVQEFRSLAEEYGTKANQQIKLATVPMFMNILSRSLESLLQHSPNVQMDIAEKSSQDILQEIRQRQIDLGFMIISSGLEADPDLEYSVLVETPVYVCVNRNSPLAGQSQLTPEDILDQRLVIYNGSIMQWLTDYFAEHDSFKFSIVTNNISTIKTSVAGGTAISVLSGMTIDNHEFKSSGDIVIIPLYAHGAKLTKKIASVKLRKRSLSRAAKQLLKHLKQQIADGSETLLV